MIKTALIIYASIILTIGVILIGSSIVVNIADKMIEAKKDYIASKEEKRLLKYHGVNCLITFKGKYYIYRDNKLIKVKDKLL